MADRGVAGMRGTEDWGVDERPKNFREMIMFREPNGQTPLLALMAGVKSDTVDDPEFSWWDEAVTIVRLWTDGVNNTTTNTTIIIKSTDPTVADPSGPWGAATHLKPGDMLLIEKATQTVTYDEEIVKVVSVTSATQFEVVRGYAGTTAAAIPDESYMTLVGNAYEEGSRAPTATTRNPLKFYNFTQIFQDTYKLTETATKTRTRTGDPLSNDKKRKQWDHQRALELAMFWGKPSEITGANGEPERTTGGLRYFAGAPTTHIFSTIVTYDNFLAAASPVFDYTTPAGDERVLFLGNQAANVLNLMIKADSDTQMHLGDVVDVFGLKLRELIVPQGRFLIKRHPLFGQNAQWSASGFMVDFAALKWRPLRGRDTKFYDNVQYRDEDAKRGLWKTEAGLMVDFAGLTIGYLGNMSAAK